MAAATDPDLVTMLAEDDNSEDIMSDEELHVMLADSGLLGSSDSGSEDDDTSGHINDSVLESANIVSVNLPRYHVLLQQLADIRHDNEDPLHPLHTTKTAEGAFDFSSHSKAEMHATLAPCAILDIFSELPAVPRTAAKSPLLAERVRSASKGALRLGDTDDRGRGVFFERGVRRGQVIAVLEQLGETPGYEPMPLRRHPSFTRWQTRMMSKLYGKTGVPPATRQMGLAATVWTKQMRQRALNMFSEGEAGKYCDAIRLACLDVLAQQLRTIPLYEQLERRGGAGILTELMTREALHVGLGRLHPAAQLLLARVASASAARRILTLTALATECHLLAALPTGIQTRSLFMFTQVSSTSCGETQILPALFPTVAAMNHACCVPWQESDSWQATVHVTPFFDMNNHIRVALIATRDVEAGGEACFVYTEDPMARPAMLHRSCLCDVCRADSVWARKASLQKLTDYRALHVLLRVQSLHTVLFRTAEGQAILRDRYPRVFPTEASQRGPTSAMARFFRDPLSLVIQADDCLCSLLQFRGLLLTVDSKALPREGDGGDPRRAPVVVPPNVGQTFVSELWHLHRRSTSKTRLRMLTAASFAGTMNIQATDASDLAQRILSLSILPLVSALHCLFPTPTLRLRVLTGRLARTFAMFSNAVWAADGWMAWMPLIAFHIEHNGGVSDRLLQLADVTNHMIDREEAEAEKARAAAARPTEKQRQELRRRVHMQRMAARTRGRYLFNTPCEGGGRKGRLAEAMFK